MTDSLLGGAIRKRSTRAWLLASLLIPLGMFVAVALYDRAVILQGAQERMRSTLDALAAQAEAVLQTAELALSLELEAVRSMDWPQIGQSEEVHQFLVGLDKQLPQIESAFFVDAEGYNSASSRRFPMPRIDLRDREYYRLAHHGETGVVISAPFIGRTRGDLVFTVSRARITDGRFDGIAAVTMMPAFFRDLYGHVVLSPEDSTVLLMRDDGTVLASYPSPLQLPQVLPADSATMQAAAQRRNFTFEAVSIRDNRPKLAGIHWLPGRNVFVVAAVDRSEVLSPWYMHVAAFAAFALIAALALAATTALAVRRAEHERDSLQALVAETRRRQEAETALQQAQKMDALGRLTGGVAHDFNNLLTAVLGSLELATRRVSDPAVMRLLKAATTAAERGAKLTAQMLAFARKQSLATQVLDINDVVRGMDELLQRTVGPLVRITYDLATAPLSVRVDRVQFELAILNLVANAHDAMTDGGDVIITIRRVREQDRVAISVTDTGAGMSPEILASAFEPFFTTKGPGKGTGLGLSMVYGFASQAGGSVSLDSAPGRGTTVTILLPRTLAAADDAVADTAAPASLSPEMGLRVLLVDDDAAAREPTAAMLHELGCSVTDVGSAAVALELLRDGTACDVLLLDFAMPDMNGAQLAATVKALRPGLPIVFLTGYADEVLLDRLRPLGAQVVTKPFRLETLSQALNKAAHTAMETTAAQD